MGGFHAFVAFVEGVMMQDKSGLAGFLGGAGPLK